MPTRKMRDFSEERENLDTVVTFSDKMLDSFRKVELLEYSKVFRDMFYNYKHKEEDKVKNLIKQVASLNESNVALKEANKLLESNNQILKSKLASKVSCNDMPKEISTIVSYYDNKVSKLKWYHLLFNPMLIIKEFNYLKDLLGNVIILKEPVNEKLKERERN